MILAAETSIPSWQSTVAVLAMCASGVSFLVGIGVLYFMKVQTAAMRDQTDLLRQQMARPQQIEQPLEIRVNEEMHQVFAGKREFESHVSHTRSEIARIDLQRGEDLRLAAQSRKTMYDKQDDMRKELTERTDAVRNELSLKIDGIPERVIATLKNTGAI